MKSVNQSDHFGGVSVESQRHRAVSWHFTSGMLMPERITAYDEDLGGEKTDAWQTVSELDFHA